MRKGEPGGGRERGGEGGGSGEQVSGRVVERRKGEGAQSRSVVRCLGISLDANDHT